MPPIGYGPIHALRGTAAEFTAENPTLPDGEVAFERDTGKAKVGDGTSTWTELPYLETPAGA